MNEKIGELLVKENLLTAEQLNNARDEARTKNERLGAQITALGYLDEAELTDFVAKQYGVPSINLEEFERSLIRQSLELTGGNQVRAA